MAADGWTSMWNRCLPRSQQARVCAERRVIELNARVLPRPLPPAVWAEFCRQADCYAAGLEYLAPNCGPLRAPDLTVVEGGGQDAAPRCDAG